MRNHLIYHGVVHSTRARRDRIIDTLGRNETLQPVMIPCRIALVGGTLDRGLMSLVLVRRTIAA